MKSPNPQLDFTQILVYTCEFHLNVCFFFFLFVFFSYLSQLLRYNGIDSVQPFYLFYFNCITRMIDLDLHVL